MVTLLGRDKAHYIHIPAPLLPQFRGIFLNRAPWYAVTKKTDKKEKAINIFSP